jgi:hypothetical protein
MSANAFLSMYSIFFVYQSISIATRSICAGITSTFGATFTIAFRAVAVFLIFGMSQFQHSSTDP